jgi:hypothetical protein
MLALMADMAANNETLYRSNQNMRRKLGSFAAVCVLGIRTSQ